MPKTATPTLTDQIAEAEAAIERLRDEQRQTAEQARRLAAEKLQRETELKRAWLVEQLGTMRPLFDGVDELRMAAIAARDEGGILDAIRLWSEWRRAAVTARGRWNRIAGAARQVGLNPPPGRQYDARNGGGITETIVEFLEAQPGYRALLALETAATNEVDREIAEVISRADAPS